MIEGLLEILESRGSIDADVGELCADIRALQEDKARLDFLDEATPGKTWEVGRGWWTIRYETSSDSEAVTVAPMGSPTLREAIDKAMKDEEAGSD